MPQVTVRSGRGRKGSSNSGTLPKNDAEIACHGSAVRRRREQRDPAHEPKPPTGALNDAADCLRLLRSPRLRPQFGFSSAVGAVLLDAGGGKYPVCRNFLKSLRSRDAIGNEGGSTRLSSASDDETEQTGQDREQVRGMPRHWLRNGQAACATRPAHLSAPMREMPGVRQDQEDRRLRLARPAAATSIVKRNADALFGPPNDMAAPGASVGGHRQHKAVRIPDRRIDLDGGAGRREVANDTIDPGAAELDGPGFQDAVARRDPVFVHNTLRDRVVRQ